MEIHSKHVNFQFDRYTDLRHPKQSYVSVCINMGCYLDPNRPIPSTCLDIDLVPCTSHPALPSSFQLLEVIGSGQFSEVRKAQNELGGLVAVKCIPKDQLSRTPRIISRETSILRQVTHPHIVQHYGCFKDDEYFYMTMELCEGGNLKQQIESKGWLGEERVKEIAKEALEALCYLHEKGIAHRDIKPENILFTRDGRVKLTDFGLSRKLVKKSNLTVVGTPYYISPEMIQGKYSSQCDVWSLGVALYFARTGLLPFDGEDLDGLFNNIRYSEITEWGECPPETVAFLKEMMLKSPVHRITPKQALQHPWLSGATRESEAQ